jgi:hypothetical protein
MKRGARLLVVEMVLPPGNTPSVAKLLDLEMLVITGGRERTADEFQTLLAEAGFVDFRMFPAEGEICVLEVKKVRCSDDAQNRYRRCVWWRTRSLTPLCSPNQNTSANPVYSKSYHTSNPFKLLDAERNLILYIFPKQRTDVGSIPD